MLSRRHLTKVVGWSPILASVLTNSTVKAKARSSDARDWYAELGISEIINAADPFTELGGAPIRPEVEAAMSAVSRRPAVLMDVQNAVGVRLSKMLGCEDAMITAGAASGLTLGVAACITGSDDEKIRALPDAKDLKNEVIIQKAHRYPYEHAVRNCGVKIIEIETADELEQTINSRTACLWFCNRWNAEGMIDYSTFVAIGRRHSIPTLIDCAADCPPASNLTKFNALGFDLVTFSGGKGLRGPSGTGLLMGRKDLIEAAKLNHNPNSSTIGRGMKVGHEEMIGLLAAIELCLKEAPDPLFAASVPKLLAIQRALARIDGLRTEIFSPSASYIGPHLRIRWDEARQNLTAHQARDQLASKAPAIYTRSGVGGVDHGYTSPDPTVGLELTAWMLRDADVPIVIRRIHELFAS